MSIKYKNIFNIKSAKVLLVLLLILATQVFSELFLVPNDMYYIIPWLDIPMHIWGGFLFGCLYIFYFNFKNSDKLFSYFNLKLTHVLAFVLLIGLIWEVYEYANDLVSYREWRGVIDTIKDLFDDMLGGAIAYFIFKDKK